MSNEALYRDDENRATIFKHPNSKNLYMSFYHNGRRVQKTTKTATLSEAIKVLNKSIMRNEIMEEQGIRHSYIKEVSIKEIAKEVIEDLERTKQPKSSYKRYITACNKVIRTVGHLEMAKVKKSSLEPLFEEELSVTVAENIRQALKRIFSKAEDKELITHPPSFPKTYYKEKMKRNAISHQQYEMIVNHFVSKIEIKRNQNRRLVEQINTQKIVELIYLLYATGMRIGEALNIKGEDITLRTSKKDGYQYVLKIKKSKTKKREILLEVDVGRYFFNEYAKNKPEQYVFLNEENGQLIAPSDIIRSDKAYNFKFYENNNLENFVLYNLRHSFITRCLLSGKALLPLSQMCGTSVKMIEDYYSDVINTVSYIYIYDEQEFNQYEEYNAEKITTKKRYKSRYEVKAEKIKEIQKQLEKEAIDDLEKERRVAFEEQKLREAVEHEMALYSLDESGFDIERLENMTRKVKEMSKEEKPEDREEELRRKANLNDIQDFELDDIPF